MNQGNYLAFISYRHREKDQRVSFLLRKELENWHMPPEAAAMKNRRVFRDTDELPTSSDLGADIENALRGSDYLIALCSEEYLESRWCMREVEEFLNMGRKERILPVLLSGKTETAVPEELRDVPAALDLRGAEGLEIRRRIRAAIPDFLSRMSGVPREQILARERRHRWTVALSVAAAVTLTLTGTALYAIRTADRISRKNEEIQAATLAAERARAEAEQEKKEAQLKNASYLTERAWEKIAEGDQDAAIDMALRALPEDLHGDDRELVEAAGALRTALSMPAVRKESYQLWKSLETDFTITGWEPLRDGYLILSNGSYGSSEWVLDCSAGTITEVESENRREAAEFGYSRFSRIHSGLGSVMVRLFYGREKQMHVSCTYEKEPYEIDMTLGGAPFFADRIVNDPEDGYFLAWMEAEEDPAGSPVGLFYAQRAEAIAALKISGFPVSASFDINHRRVAVVDGEGTLSLFETATGEKKAVVKGTWKQVCYPNTGRYFCAVSADGKAYYFDAVSLKPIHEFRCESPVKSLLYTDGEILACCEKGVRIFNMSDGEQIWSLVAEEGPTDAVWTRYVSNQDSGYRDGIVLLYERRADIYLLSGDTDGSRTHTVSLHQSGESSMNRSVFYSPDGEYIYLVKSNGGLSKWKAADGTWCWGISGEGNMNAQGHSGEIARLSKDPSVLWKLILNNGHGIQKINAETGEIIYTALWGERGKSLTAPKEDCTGTRGLVEEVYAAGPLIVFDTRTGDKIWEKDINTCGAVFSPDGKEVWCIWTTYREDGPIMRDTQKSYFCRLDTETGDVLEEREICEKSGNVRRDVYLNEAEYAAVIVMDRHSPVRVDYRTGETVRWEDVVLNSGDELIFPCDGGTAVRWEDRENDRTLVRRLNPDGTVGPVLDAETPEGRRLAADRRQYGVFAGEEIVQMPAEGETAVTEKTVRRLSDGAVMMDLKSDRYYYGITVAPDGSSLCIYAYYYIPVVIPASDPETLAELARQHLGGNGQ